MVELRYIKDTHGTHNLNLGIITSISHICSYKLPQINLSCLKMISICHVICVVVGDITSIGF